MHRMHDLIAQFPSKVLYGSKLTADESVAAHLLRDLPNTKATSEEDEKEVLGTPVVFFDTAGCEYFARLEGDGEDGSRCNENEATVVKNWVETLVSDSQDRGISPSYADGHSLSKGWMRSNTFTNRGHHSVRSPHPSSAPSTLNPDTHLFSFSQVPSAGDPHDVALAPLIRLRNRDWNRRRDAGPRKRSHRDQPGAQQRNGEHGLFAAIDSSLSPMTSFVDRSAKSVS